MSPRTASQRLLRVGPAVALALLALPLVTLIGHRSQLAPVLGRWSRGYTAFLAAYAALVTLAALATWLGFRADVAAAERAAARVARLRRVRPLFAALLVLPWLALGAGLDAMQLYAPGRSALVQLSWLALVIWSNCLLLLAGQCAADAGRSIGRYALLLGGVACSLALAEVVLRRHPQLIPDAARARLPGDGLFLRSDLVFERPVGVGYRYRPKRDETLTFRRSNGDLHRRPQGPRLTLPEPGDDTVLAQYRFVTDEDGFPNPPPLRERYDVVTAGDSFTAPVVVGTPWPRVLEQLTGLSVLNVAIGGHAIQQAAAAATQYGLARRPRWVVLAYFEGNDLNDAPAYEAKRRSGRSWIEDDLANAGPYATSVALQSLFGALRAALPTAAPAAAPRVPFVLELGGQRVSVAFYAPYLAMLTATRADIEASANLAAVRDMLVALRDATAAARARLLLTYVPSKEHVYASLIGNADLMRRALAGVQPLARFPDGVLRALPIAATPEQVWAHRDDQRDAIAQLARQQRVDLLDLTPVFVAEAARGADLYYTADTHWNQAGHDLAGRQVAARLAAQRD